MKTIEAQREYIRIRVYSKRTPEPVVQDRIVMALVRFFESIDSSARPEGEARVGSFFADYSAWVLTGGTVAGTWLLLQSAAWAFKKVLDVGYSKLPRISRSTEPSPSTSTSTEMAVVEPNPAMREIDIGTPSEAPRSMNDLRTAIEFMKEVGLDKLTVGRLSSVTSAGSEALVFHGDVLVLQREPFAGNIEMKMISISTKEEFDTYFR